MGVYTIPQQTFDPGGLEEAFIPETHFTDDDTLNIGYKSGGNQRVYTFDDGVVGWIISKGASKIALYIVFASSEPNKKVYRLRQENPTLEDWTLTDTFTWDNKTVYYKYFDYYPVSDPTPDSVTNVYTVVFFPFAKLSWLAFYGGYLPPPTTDPYAGGASAGTTGGGEGTSDNSDDLGTEVIAEPTEPTVSAVQTGFLSLWTGTQSEINAIASFLWNDLANVQDVLNALIRIVADPMKLIIGLSIVPSQGLHKGSYSAVTVGPFLTGLNLQKLTSQYFTVDCGSLSFDTVCGDTFLDYAPYSKFSIYLPYIGTRTVDANDFVGHTISVKYKGDALTGNCVALILKDSSVMYQFAGSLSSNCPLSSNDWTQTIMSAVQMAATGISLAATGGASAPAAAAMGAGEASSLSSLALNAASNISGNVSQLSPQVMKSGAVSGASGLLGVQTPYIIREAVSYQDTSEFNTLGGYPSNIYSLLSDLTGYTEVQSIHLTGMTCTQAEMDEIETLLHQGVII